MTIRTIFTVALALIISLCSCAKQSVTSDDQLFGEWVLVDDPTNQKRIWLEADGKARFVAIDASDFAIDGKKALPANGKWNFSADRNILGFMFILNGATYDHSGELIQGKDGLEVRFSVGDPDNFEWKRFRLVKPTVE